MLFLPVKEGAEYQIFQTDTSSTRPGDEQFPKTPTRCMEGLPLTVRTDLGEFWLYWAGPQLQVNNRHVPWVSLYNSSYNVIIIKGRVSQITPQQILSEPTKQKQKHYPPWGLFRQKLGLWQHKQDRLGDLSQWSATEKGNDESWERDIQCGPIRKRNKSSVQWPSLLPSLSLGYWLMSNKWRKNWGQRQEACVIKQSWSRYAFVLQSGLQMSCNCQCFPSG